MRLREARNDSRQFNRNTDNVAQAKYIRGESNSRLVTKTAINIRHEGEMLFCSRVSSLSRMQTLPLNGHKSKNLKSPYCIALRIGDNSSYHSFSQRRHCFRLLSKTRLVCVTGNRSYIASSHKVPERL